MLQYDFLAGYDPSGDAQISGALILQAINQIEPLANIGGIVYGDTAPDVVSNPRFSRYIWLDSTSDRPVLKLWDDVALNWSASTIAAGSIIATMLADYAVSVLNGSDAPKIAYKQNATADASKANNVLCLDGAGQYVNVATVISLIAAGAINLNKLDISGITAGDLLYKNSSGALAGIAPASIISIAAGSIPFTAIQDQGIATNNYLLRIALDANGRYTPVAVINEDKTAAGGLFPDNSIKIQRLYYAAAANLDTIRFDGTNWVKKTPFYGAPTVGGTTVPAVAAGGILYAPHGLGAQPRTIECYLECGVNDIGYTAALAERVRADNLFILRAAAGEQMTAVTIGADATNIFAVFQVQSGAGAEYRLIDKATFARAAITPGSWNVKFYAEL
jgi:hypothetical protein